MASIWGSNGGVAATPAAGYRVPVDLSAGGTANHYTTQQLADLATLVGTTHNALGSINSATAIDLSAGPYVSATIAGALTFTFTNPPASPNGCEWTLVLTNGGSAIVTWPGSVTWAGSTAPTLTASGTDVLHFVTGNGGTNWYGWHERDEATAAAGSSGQAQYNDAGAFGGMPIWREDANTVAQRNGTTAQALYLYKTTDGGSNYARLRFSMGVDDSMSLQIFGQKSGTGAYTNVDIGFSNTQLLRQDGTNATLFGQNFKPFEDNTYDIGSSSAGWRTGYFDTSVITPTLTNAGTAVVAATRLRADGFGTALSSKSADYTAVATDSTLLVDATAAARTITLPAASGATGRIYVVKKTDAGGNSVTVDANASGTIDGATTYVLATQYKFVAIQCDGSNWHVIGAN